MHQKFNGLDPSGQAQGENAEIPTTKADQQPAAYDRLPDQAISQKINERVFQIRLESSSSVNIFYF